MCDPTKCYRWFISSPSAKKRNASMAHLTIKDVIK